MGMCRLPGLMCSRDEDLQAPRALCNGHLQAPRAASSPAPSDRAGLHSCSSWKPQGAAFPAWQRRQLPARDRARQHARQHICRANRAQPFRSLIEGT